MEFNTEGVPFVTVSKSSIFSLNKNESAPKKRSERKRLFPPRLIPTANGSLPFELQYGLHKNDRRLRGISFRKYVEGSAIKWSVFENPKRFEPEELDVSLVIVTTFDCV